MKDSSKVKAADERITEAVAKMLQEADEERKTKPAKTVKEQTQQDSRAVEANEGERSKNDEEMQDSLQPTKRADQGHGGREGGATSSG